MSAATKDFKIREFPVEENPKEHYLNAASGLKSWLFTVDHKRIGLMYLASIIFFFLCWRSAGSGSAS